MREVAANGPWADALAGVATVAPLLEPESYYAVLAESCGEIDIWSTTYLQALAGPDAVLVNVSRGGLVDEEALADALERGRLRGAALDVFTAEPLPAGHRLWRAPRLLITPHVSAYTHGFWAREGSLIGENLRRWAAGEPLRNVVDKAAGY